jgi:NADH pyrophosphatase NudC (nudix superfamily)
MNLKAKKRAYIMAMVGAGLIMVGYALMMKAHTIGVAMLVTGLVMLAVCGGFALMSRQYKFCPKCGLKVTDMYIKQNVKRFKKYKCPKCGTRQLPVIREKK